MACTEEQIKKLMKYAGSCTLEAAAAKAGMSLRTARDYLKRGGRMKQKKRREHRTRPDPFAEVWPEVKNLLESDSGLEAKTVMEWLDQRYPGQFENGQLRTLQRRVKDWRVLEGPERKEVMFPQDIQPGRQSQSDYTHCTKLGITIAGEPFPHMLFHFMLPYSRWEFVEIAHTESLASLMGGYLRAVEELGATAPEHRTDNLAAAVPIGKRGEFQERWKNFLQFYGVHPSANNPRRSHENGSVEKSNDLFKNALDQRLRLRGSRNFGSLDAYEAYLREMLHARNRQRRERLTEELKLLQPLPAPSWADPKELTVTVSAWSTIVVQRAIYSVPSRLIGTRLRATVYKDKIEVYYGTRLVQCMPKVGPGERVISYRHIIAHLLRKPKAFTYYQFREELFPSSVFRRALDDLLSRKGNDAGEREYLQILNLAAIENELDVASALQLLLETSTEISESSVRQLIARKFEMPTVEVKTTPLSVYDELLTFRASEVASA
jgi:transposase